MKENDVRTKIDALLANVTSMQEHLRLSFKEQPIIEFILDELEAIQAILYE